MFLSGDLSEYGFARTNSPWWRCVLLNCPPLIWIRNEHQRRALTMDGNVLDKTGVDNRTAAVAKDISRSVSEHTVKWSALP